MLQELPLPLISQLCQALWGPRQGSPFQTSASPGVHMTTQTPSLTTWQHAA